MPMAVWNRERRREDKRRREKSRLEAEYAQICAELDVVEHDAAWSALGDSEMERAEGARLAQTADALRHARRRIEESLRHLEGS